jgi:hypothetical protein
VAFSLGYLDKLAEEVRGDLGAKWSQAQFFKLTYISAALCIRRLASPSTTIPPPVLLQSSITIDCPYRLEKFQRVAQYFFIGRHDSVCFTASGGGFAQGNQRHKCPEPSRTLPIGNTGKEVEAEPKEVAYTLRAVHRWSAKALPSGDWVLMGGAVTHVDMRGRKAWILMQWHTRIDSSSTATNMKESEICGVQK